MKTKFYYEWLYFFTLKFLESECWGFDGEFESIGFEVMIQGSGVMIQRFWSDDLRNNHHNIKNSQKGFKFIT